MSRYPFYDVIGSFAVAGINNINFSFSVSSFIRPTAFPAVKNYSDFMRSFLFVFDKFSYQSPASFFQASSLITTQGVGLPD
jgi:hypothetical protein